MKDAGFGGDRKEDMLYSMMFLASINMVSNLVGMSLSGKHGRRELILKTTIPMGISLIALAITMFLNTIITGFTRKFF